MATHWAVAEGIRMEASLDHSTPHTWLHTVGLASTQSEEEGYHQYPGKQQRTGLEACQLGQGKLTMRKHMT